MARHQRASETAGTRTLLLGLGVGLAAVTLGYAVARGAQQNRVAFRPGDDAPGRTARPTLASRLSREPHVVGRTITVNRPRHALFAFWDDFTNLSQFMQSVERVTVDGDVARWQVTAPLGVAMTIETRVTERVEGARLVWASTPASDVEARGRVLFRDAPAGRGTEIEAEIAYTPPMGELGRVVGLLFQADPAMQGRRELRRFKMLMEAGEIATNVNHKPKS